MELLIRNKELYFVQIVKFIKMKLVKVLNQNSRDGRDMMLVSLPSF
jgi:hypothetical protein